MRKIITGLVVVGAIVFSSQAAVAATKAQPAAATPSNVAVVNVADILHASQQVKNATAKIKKDFAPQQKKIQEMQAQLQTDTTALERDGSTMSPADKKAAEDKVEQERQAVVKQIAAFQKGLTDAQTTTMKAIFDQLNDVISGVATEGGYDIVIDSQFVVYNNNANDITGQVQKAFSAV